MSAGSRTRVTAAALAILAALSLSVTAPSAADAGIKGGPSVVALVAPGQPPLPCVPGRYRCPLGGGLL
ncbi:hypothetical protein [Leifsonia sp. fls2-241-R2A-40a]|uniref:hypothetical protein n=1 Tax=Leifsonia sp. fls2-241-R2A-40a TaxID=3040290 RepID=UPI00254D777F|nr:hypothetical protein [Leifsonia sp. fls2-241-R2A-40a]